MTEHKNLSIEKVVQVILMSTHRWLFALGYRAHQEQNLDQKQVVIYFSNISIMTPKEKNTNTVISLVLPYSEDEKLKSKTKPCAPGETI